MGSTAKKIVGAVAAAVAAPAMLFGAGIANAAELAVTAEPQITNDGIWIRWTGGSGGWQRKNTACNFNLGRIFCGRSVNER